MLLSAYKCILSNVLFKKRDAIVVFEKESMYFKKNNGWAVSGCWYKIKYKVLFYDNVIVYWIISNAMTNKMDRMRVKSEMFQK